MSLNGVKTFFQQYGIENRIIEMDQSTATVDLAAKAHGVEPGQIGKTLSFKIDDEPVLVLTSGDAKIDNKKYKVFFCKKAKMLTPEEALEHTGHEVGGICPFGLKKPVKTYLDVSMKRFAEIIPAAGSINSSIRLTLAELEKYTEYAEWIDVCKL
ncbi:MAG: YbaK/EbsC family protein [Spirochaetia bacterium]